MEKYLNRGGNSNIESYIIGDDYVEVLFKGSSKHYTYSYAKAGVHHVENMKELAEIGSGLNSYIMKNVRFKYD